MSKKIIVVNGSNHTNDQIQHLLAKRNYKPQHFNVMQCHGLEALDYLKMFNVDFIIIDFTCNAIDSLCLIKYLTNDERYCSIPVLAISNTTDEDPEDLSVREHGIGIIPPSLLSQHLEHMLNKTNVYQ